MIQPSKNVTQQGAEQISCFRQELAQLTENQVFSLSSAQQAIDEFHQNHPSQHH